MSAPRTAASESATGSPGTHGPPDTLLALLRQNPLVPVLRATSGDLLVRVGQVLAGTGVRAVELTASTPGAYEALAALRDRVPSHVRVGMGTVLSGHDADRAIQAGADFLVTPCVVPDVAAAAAQACLPVVLGAWTPTEVRQAWELRPELVKVFPAGQHGLAHLKALRDVYPQIPLMPSGGINGETADQYLRAGAVAVSVGGSQIGAALRGEGDLQAMADAVSRLCADLRPSTRPDAQPA